MNTTFDILRKCINTANSIDCEQLLDDWSEDVLHREDYSFETGLLGLGWLVNYLIHEKYMYGNADEILEDIDDTIYKLTIKEVTEESIHVDELLYFVTYYQQRLNYNSNAHFYRKFTHFECLKLLLQKLNVFLLNTYLYDKDNIKHKVDILLKYSFLMKTCVNEKLVEEAFYHACENIIEYYQNHIQSISLDNLYKLGLGAKQYSNPYWENKIESIVSVHKTDSHFYLKTIFEQSKSANITWKHKENSTLFQNLTSYELFYLITNLKITEDA